MQHLLLPWLDFRVKEGYNVHEPFGLWDLVRQPEQAKVSEREPGEGGLLEGPTAGVQGRPDSRVWSMLCPQGLHSGLGPDTSGS